MISIDKNLGETLLTRKLVYLHTIMKSEPVINNLNPYHTFQKQTFPQLRPPTYSNLSISEVLTQQAENHDVSVWTDPGLIQPRCFATPEIIKTFEKGLKCYLEGNWEEARTILGKVSQMMPSNDVGGDGPRYGGE
jgi:hypothetical protein